MSKEKKQKLKNFLDAFKTLPTDAQVETAVEKFNTYWPFVKSGLEFLESRSFTGKKRDEQLNAFVAQGDELAADPDLATKIQAFIEKMKEIWEKARKWLVVLVDLKVTGEEFDNAVTKFIEIGDEFTGTTA